tara:strand:+ start:317 stop:487 length:171 start_codon:yes stop_codon:yes gene_type:complete
MENKKTETCVFSKLSKKIADIEISLGKLNECLRKIKQEHQEEDEENLPEATPEGEM